MTMIEHNFIARNRQQSILLKELKATQNHCTEPERAENPTFNAKIHAEIFKKPDQEGNMVLSITNEGMKHLTTTQFKTKANKRLLKVSTTTGSIHLDSQKKSISKRKRGS